MCACFRSSSAQGSRRHPRGSVQVPLITQQIWLPEQSESETQGRPDGMLGKSTGGTVTGTAAPTVETTTAASTRRMSMLLFMAPSSYMMSSLLPVQAGFGQESHLLSSQVFLDTRV